MDVVMEEEDGFSSSGSNDFAGEEGIVQLQEEPVRVELEKRFILQERTEKEPEQVEDMNRCKQEGELLKNMLEDDIFTKNERKLIQKTHDHWKLHDGTLRQWTRFVVVTDKLKSNDTAPAEWSELRKSHKQFLKEIGDESTLKEKLKRDWGKFDKAMDQAKAVLLLKGVSIEKYYASSSTIQQERSTNDMVSAYEVEKKSHEKEINGTREAGESLGNFLRNEHKLAKALPADDKKTIQDARAELWFFRGKLEAEVSRLFQNQQKLTNAVSADEEEKLRQELLSDDRTCRYKLQKSKASLKKLMDKSHKILATFQRGTQL